MRTIEWANGAVKLIDQRKLPTEYVIEEIRDYRELGTAIKDMHIRGAPAIGAAAAFGIVLAAQQYAETNRDEFLIALDHAADFLRSTRPTAVNLFWAITRMLQCARRPEYQTAAEIIKALEIEAQTIADEDVEINQRMGAYGATVIDEGDHVLTHCNAGALATVDYGTALGVIRAAHAQGKNIHVWVDETRPRLQGARLTAWELLRDNIPMTLIADNAAGQLMRTGRVDVVLFGADRVAANGDVANKVGSYKLAVVARENGIPCYAVSPTSTIDMTIATGDDIPIEERPPTEVTHIRGVQIAPNEVPVLNIAFDVTPHRYLTGIITERGIVYPPFGRNLRRIME